MMRNTTVDKLFPIVRNPRVPGGSDEDQRTTIVHKLGH